MAAEGTVGVVQGLTVELEVYVSGYPKPVGSGITWQHPNQSVIMNTDGGVVFKDGRRRMILSSVQPQQAGLYTCTVVISISPYRGASTGIQLDVYGEYILMLLAMSCI